MSRRSAERGLIIDLKWVRIGLDYELERIDESITFCVDTVEVLSMALDNILAVERENYDDSYRHFVYELNAFGVTMNEADKIFERWRTRIVTLIEEYTGLPYTDFGDYRRRREHVYELYLR